MSENKKRIRDGIIGVLLALLFVVPGMERFGLFDPVPYSYVGLIEEEKRDGDLSLTFTFLKTDQCTFEELDVFGKEFQEWLPIRWSYNQVETGDRLEGWHTFGLTVKEWDRYTLIEVRTRHLCEGKKKDSVFYAYPP